MVNDGVAQVIENRKLKNKARIGTQELISAYFFKLPARNFRFSVVFLFLLFAVHGISQDVKPAIKWRVGKRINN